jgi:penicillin-binding protein 1A
LILGVGGAYGGLQLYRYYASDLPDIAQAESFATVAPGITRVYAADGVMMRELAREHRAYVEYEDVPEELIHAFLSAEDRRFWTHPGLDFRGLARAMVANVRSGTIVQGGSTITQQVAKYFLVNKDRTLGRKAREAIFSLRLESRLGKQDILEIYLNGIFLGNRSYGVASAAHRYFDRPLDELRLGEFAMLAGLARAPSRYNPARHPERAQKRREVVLQDMVEAGYITEAQRDEAAATPLRLASREDPWQRRAPYYSDQVRRALITALGNEAIKTGQTPAELADQPREVVVQALGEKSLLEDGLTIETPAALPREALAHASLDKAVRKLDRKHGFRGPEAHLRRPKARDELLARLKTHYGQRVLEDPGRWYLALVTDVERNQATVDLGERTAVLPLRHAAWAAPFKRDTGVNDRTIKRLDETLVPGDVIWVQGVYRRDEGEPEDAPGHLTQDEEGRPKVRLGQTPRVEAALYAYDHQSGYVEAMAGGHDYDRSQFNRPVQACRQPGSVFKAIYYALALDGGKWRMDSFLEARPYVPEPGEDWNPRDITKTLDGRVLFRTALIKSLNTPSLRLFLALGAHKVVKWARRLGFTTELIADKGLSLGASCVRTDELTRAFGTFARNGSQRSPVYVKRVVDKTGRVRVDLRHPYDAGLDVAGRFDRMGTEAIEAPKQLIDARTNFLISRLLREVVLAGTATRASRIGAPAAGKSGTASGRVKIGGVLRDMTTDTWFVGFTSRHAVAAWMGFDDASYRSLGDDEASYTTAIPMWADFMKAFVGQRKYTQLPTLRPPGITSRVAEAAHGGPPIEGLPIATLYFLEGTENAWQNEPRDY